MRTRLTISLLAALVAATLTATATAAPRSPVLATPQERTPAARSAPAGADPTNWPQFRFDQARTGFQPHEKVLSKSTAPRLQLSWQGQLGDLVFSSSPAVVDGVVYIGSLDGRLWAYPADGCGQDFCSTPLWSSTSLSQIVDSPTLKKGIVYVGSQTSPTSNDGKLNAFAASGCGQSVCAPLWQGKAGPESILNSSPAVAGGIVFVGAFDGKLYAFAATGCGKAKCDPLWTASTGGSIESSPTVVNGVVYIGSDDGNLYAFPAQGCGQIACDPLWSGPIGGPAFDSSPAVANGDVFIGSDHFLAAFPAGGCGHTTCDPLWRGTHQQDFLGGSPAVFKDRVYIGLESEVGVFDANGCGFPTCGPMWVDFGSGAQAIVASSPTVANGVVYAGRNTAQVLAWKAGPCRQFQCPQIWSGATNDSIVNSSPTVVNGKLYVGSSDNHFPEDVSGRLYVFALP